MLPVCAGGIWGRCLERVFNNMDREKKGGGGEGGVLDVGKTLSESPKWFRVCSTLEGAGYAGWE